MPNLIFSKGVDLGKGLSGVVLVQYGAPLHDALLPLRDQHVWRGQGVHQQDRGLPVAGGEGQPGQPENLPALPPPGYSILASQQFFTYRVFQI